MKNVPSHHIRAQAGFTLVELLLAVAIFALVSLAGFSVFDTVRKSDELSQRKLNQLNQLLIMLKPEMVDNTDGVRRHGRVRPRCFCPS